MSDMAHKREQGPAISVPVPRPMFERIKSAAEAADRSVASFARIALAKELERQGGEGAHA
jgi:hypothetical protein